MDKPAHENIFDIDNQRHGAFVAQLKKAVASDAKGVSKKWNELPHDSRAKVWEFLLAGVEEQYSTRTDVRNIIHSILQNEGTHWCIFDSSIWTFSFTKARTMRRCSCKIRTSSSSAVRNTVLLPMAYRRKGNRTREKSRGRVLQFT